jgi:hypothetical protein
MAANDGKTPISRRRTQSPPPNGTSATVSCDTGVGDEQERVTIRNLTRCQRPHLYVLAHRPGKIDQSMWLMPKFAAIGGTQVAAIEAAGLR